MGAMASKIASLTIVYSTVYSSADQRIHQSSASLAFVCGIHRWPVNCPHKWLVTRKMFPFDDVIMRLYLNICHMMPTGYSELQYAPDVDKIWSTDLFISYKQSSDKPICQDMLGVIYNLYIPVPITKLFMGICQVFWWCCVKYVQIL